MQPLRAAAALMLSLAMAGCATLARGMHQNFDVQTEPPGAKITTSNGLGCPATPCTIEKVSREAKFTVTAQLDGYEPATAQVTHTTSAAGAAAVAASFAIPGGILWSLIDANFGASQDLSPNPLKLELKKAGDAGLKR